MGAGWGGEKKAKTVIELVCLMAGPTVPVHKIGEPPVHSQHVGGGQTWIGMQYCNLFVEIFLI